MANGAPTFTAENYHLFQPSQIETGLANAVDDPARPSAFPMLMSYRAQREGNDANYQSTLDNMHQMQLAEFNQTQQNNGRTQMLTGLKDAKTPGEIAVMKQLGIIPQGIDTSQWEQNLTDDTAATNVGNAGRGLGPLLQGGTNIPDTTLQRFVPGATSGTPAIVQAARENSAGRVAAAGIGQGGVTYSAPVGDIGPNQATAHWKQPAGTGPIVPGNTSLPPAPGSSTPTAQPTTQQVQQKVVAGLPNVAAANPAAHADILAGAINGQPNVIFSKERNAMVIQGKNNQYPVAPFMK